MLSLEKYFDRWWSKTQTTTATPLVFKCYKAGYKNAIKHVVLILLILSGVVYVVI